MHKQLYVFMAALKKAEITPTARRVVAETIVSASNRSSQKGVPEGILRSILSDRLYKALTELEFKISEASEAELVQDDEVYERIDHILQVLSQVASAQPSIMPDLACAISSPEHWEAWEMLSALNSDQLGKVCSLYLVERVDALWTVCSNSMKNINQEEAPVGKSPPTQN